ncbi:unnamed protein product [Penicillium salamii]|nr:unnamed protein product [Penicillium salamii]CAG8131921.1 unnamed protein product [Penicillium salamii]CAG8363446.1 unnamed protein product [Penicillium salamii]
MLVHVPQVEVNQILDSLLEGELDFPTLLPRRSETTTLKATLDDSMEMDAPRTRPSAGPGPTFNPISSDAEVELPAGSKTNLERTTAKILPLQQEGIKWMPGLSGIFDGLKSLPIGEARLLETGKTRFDNLPVIRIGLRYVPKVGVQDFRTVTVTNFSPSTTLAEVLRYVRGGEVLTATMCDTKAITGSSTALVTFSTAKGAAEFVRTAEEVGFFIGFHQAHVAMVDQPTYPTRRILQDRIDTRGRTRALTVFNNDGRTKMVVHEALSKSLVAGHIEGFKDHPVQKQVTVLFYSVDMAMKAFKILYESPNITKVWFGCDPCGRHFVEKEAKETGGTEQAKVTLLHK